MIHAEWCIGGDKGPCNCQHLERTKLLSDESHPSEVPANGNLRWSDDQLDILARVVALHRRDATFFMLVATGHIILLMVLVTMLIAGVLP